MMRKNLAWLCIAGLMAGAMTSSSQAQDVVLTEDSKPQAGVPAGKIVGPIEWKSKIFPGTVRNYWLYIPAQYDPAKKTCVHVQQDGLRSAQGWKLIQVLDNLIHKKEIPPQIGIFIEPGVVPALSPDSESRYNRSYEYDAVGDRYARFLVEEILPAVKKDYNISDDPNDRAIGGSSSGAICAFNVAWERPDQFRRVISAIGTYVGLRGADQFPTLIRKTEPKPIRVFLEDGSNDLNNFAGDWYVANLAMLSALKHSGYEVEHRWGDGAHNAKHMSEVLPDAMRFAWKNYPEPIKAPAPQANGIECLIEGEKWQEVSSGHKFTEGPAVNQAGEVFFSDIPEGKIHKIDLDGKVTLFAENLNRPNGLMFGVDGKLYCCESGASKIIRFNKDASKEDVVDGIAGNDLVLLKNGHGYVTEPSTKKVWWFNTEGKKKVVDTGIETPNGVIASPDQTFLTVADSVGRMTFSFQIQPDGSLANKQTFGWLHLSDEARRSGADGLAVDTAGNLYACTRFGLQVLDQPGRVRLIMERPQPGPLANVVFAGPERDVLFATCGDKVFKRKVQAKGVLYFQDPVKPPKPRL